MSKNVPNLFMPIKRCEVVLPHETLKSLWTFSGNALGYKIVQRGMDILVSIIVIIVTAPLMLLLAIIIKFDSPGPALFKQYRTGVNRRDSHNTRDKKNENRRQKNLFGKQFGFYKFRTMYIDARKRWPELYDYSYSEEELKTQTLKGENDPRVTRVGKWLRRTSLDELPNFLNVLKGEMHLVGPRPDICDIAENYPQKHLKKFDVKPGITGLAQINGRNKLTFFYTNECDMEYIKNRNVALDVKILLKTVLIVLKGKDGF